MNTREAITQLIFTSDMPKRVDIVMVLGCASISNMEPAIDLYRLGWVNKILISGKGPTSRCRAEWLVYRQYALDEGIPSSGIFIEDQARNTRENFMFSEAIISREIGWSNVKGIAIVTSPIHTRRAQMTARRYFPPSVSLTMLASSDEQCIRPETWWKSRTGRLLVLDELRRIGEYAVKGDLADF